MRAVTAILVGTSLLFAACGDDSVELVSSGASGEEAIVTTLPETVTPTTLDTQAELQGGPLPEIQMYADQRDISYEEAAAELDAQAELMRWADSVRREPWYDGFQFEQTDAGTSSVVALDMSANPPPLPPDLPIRSVVSRMGQREWNDFVPGLTAEMEKMDVTGLSYDPFNDSLTITRGANASSIGKEDEVAERVVALLGDAFDGIGVEFGPSDDDSFESPPPTTR